MEFRYRDPIHGFIIVREHEQRIIESYPFQRLRNIRQLALTSYVYYSAEHTRFGHSIGVMHLATRAFRSAISRSRFVFVEGNEDENAKRIEWLEQVLRLIALTHDLGHSPFSHASEDVFPTYKDANGKDKHYKHEHFTQEIIKKTEISTIISEIGQSFVKRLGAQYNITPDMICDIYSGKDAGKENEFIFLKTLMDSELDCDKMDYLLRDSLFCGVSYGRFDVERLLSCLTIFTKKGERTPFLAIESGGVHAFEEFVLARYFMFVQVYFHRTRRYFDLILSHALKECLPNGSLPINVDEYLKWDDVTVFNLLKQSPHCKKAGFILNCKAWNCIYSTKTHPDGDSHQLFDTVLKILKKRFKVKKFKEHFLIDTSADKMPHKIIPRKHLIDDEEVIAIVNRETRRISTISDESHIISNLTEKINIQRIYVDDECFEDARKEVLESVGDTEEDENDE